MFKFVIGGRRSAGLTHRDYSRHAQIVHGGLVLDGPAEMRRYVQNHVVDSAYGDPQAGWVRGADFDSFSEIWYDDAEAMKRSLADRHYQEHVKPDEARFVDASVPVLLATEEEDQPVAQPRNGGIKAMRILKRDGALDRAAWIDAWRAEGARLAAHPELSRRLCRMTRSISLPVAEGEVRGDFAFGALLNTYAGAESVWFDRDDDLAGFDAYRAAIAEPASLLGPHLARRDAILLLIDEKQIFPVETR